MPQAPLPTLNPLNLRILRCLASRGRISYTELAEELHLSINTVRDRILSMERKGVVQGYRAVLDDARLGARVRVLALLEGNGHKRTQPLDGIAGGSAVRAPPRSSDRYPLVLELSGESLEGVQDYLAATVYPAGFRPGRFLLLGRSIVEPHRTLLDMAAEPRLEEPRPEPELATPEALN